MTKRVLAGWLWSPRWRACSSSAACHLQPVDRVLGGETPYYFFDTDFYRKAVVR